MKFCRSGSLFFLYFLFAPYCAASGPCKFLKDFHLSPSGVEEGSLVIVTQSIEDGWPPDKVFPLAKVSFRHPDGQILVKMEDDTFDSVRKDQVIPLVDSAGRDLDSRLIPQDTKFKEDESYVFSDQLPSGIGIVAPRPVSEAALSVAVRILGSPPRPLAAFQNIPKLNIEAQELSIRLLSDSHNGGTSNAYVAKVLVGDTKKYFAVKVDRHSKRAFNITDDDLKTEVVNAHVLGEMGIGPKVYGVGTVDGRQAIVMDAIRGDFPHGPLPQSAISDLESAVSKLNDAGMAIPDFQYFLTTENRIVILDVGKVLYRGNPDYEAVRKEMIQQLQSEQLKRRSLDHYWHQVQGPLRPKGS